MFVLLWKEKHIKQKKNERKHKGQQESVGEKNTRKKSLNVRLNGIINTEAQKMEGLPHCLIDIRRMTETVLETNVLLRQNG